MKLLAQPGAVSGTRPFPADRGDKSGGHSSQFPAPLGLPVYPQGPGPGWAGREPGRGSVARVCRVMQAKQTRLLCEGPGICAHRHGNHTERGGEGRWLLALFTDVRPPQPQTWGWPWVAWRLGAGGLDRHLPLHGIPGLGLGDESLAQDSDLGCGCSWHRRAEEPCQPTCQECQAEIRAAGHLPG